MLASSSIYRSDDYLLVHNFLDDSEHYEMETVKEWSLSVVQAESMRSKERLVSQIRGLLDVHDCSSFELGARWVTMRYTHRTVGGYLRSPKAQAELSRRASFVHQPPVHFLRARMFLLAALARAADSPDWPEEEGMPREKCFDHLYFGCVR